MKIAVCVKQVPVISRMQFDYESKTIQREGVPLEVNSFDMLAVARAADLVEAEGGEVVAVTMGPPQAEEALVQCQALGANRGIHLTDRAMAGADTLATARTLTMALEQDTYDLIMCGRNSTDAETGQVGPELAELLGLPFVGNVRRLDYERDGNCLRLERETDDGYEVIRCPLPALVSVCEGLVEERFPSRQKMQEAMASPNIQKMSAIQLTSDRSLMGSPGSPTWVADIQLVEPSRRGEVIEEDDPGEAARRVVSSLGSLSVPGPDKPKGSSRYGGGVSPDIWVVADPHISGIRSSTLEILGKARELAEVNRCEVVTVHLPAPDARKNAATLADYGADRVVLMEAESTVHPSSARCASALAKVILVEQPYAVLFGSTANGRDLASRIAANLALGLTGDCIDLAINDDGELVQFKPALGGNVVAPIQSKTTPYMATLRPGLLNPIEPTPGAVHMVEVLDIPPIDAPDFEVLEVHHEEDAQGLELAAARVVMGVGMGIGGPENLPAIQELAQSLGAVIAATRNVTDAGWLPRQVQVGLTGRAIAPQLYIAVGIRGDFNHMVGLQKAGTIIAINDNPNPRRSPIIAGADFTIIGDWQEYLPPLVEALKPIVAP
ncbi:MAG: FAD-binding protein [Dehalococcoidia bacterium]|nr:FAD-binding protein [Dehalococcoidia bacterium]